MRGRLFEDGLQVAEHPDELGDGSLIQGDGHSILLCEGDRELRTSRARQEPPTGPRGPAGYAARNRVAPAISRRAAWRSSPLPRGLTQKIAPKRPLPLDTASTAIRLILASASLSKTSRHRADAIVALEQEAGLLHGELESELLRGALQLGRVLRHQVELRHASAGKAGKREQIDARGGEAGRDLRCLPGLVRNHHVEVVDLAQPVAHGVLL